MTDVRVQIAAARRRDRVIVAGLVALALLVGWYAISAQRAQTEVDLSEGRIESLEASGQERAEQIDALATALDQTREQLLDEGVAPVAPPAEDIVDEPVPPVTVDSALIRAIAEDVMAGILPGAARAEIHDAVADAQAACVASGACVGPVPPAEEVLALVTAAVAAFCADDACVGQAGADGLPGAPGPPPSPEEIAAAVAAYCSTGACQGPPGYPVSLTIQLTNGTRLVCTDPEKDLTYLCL